VVERSKFEGALQDLCVARGIAVTPCYGPASGYLTGVRSGAAKGFHEGNGLKVLAPLDGARGDRRAGCRDRARLAGRPAGSNRSRRR
jgi:hypothetical protein